MTFVSDFLLYIIFAVYLVDVVLLFAFGLHAFLMIYLSRKNPEHCVSGADGTAAIDLKKTPARNIPRVTVQLPIYNEFYVVERLIDSAVQIEWPKNKLEIQVLDDSTDETREKAGDIVARYRKLGYNIHHIHRVDRVGHKAGALRAGLEVARGEFIAIFDADFLPTPEFLVKTIPYFAEGEVGMVQTRWGHINTDYSVLTRAQSMGIDGHFMIEQTARNAAGLWMNFNGTGGVWRRQCIVEAGNWQADTLTEDFDLSYRAALAGWKFRYFKDVSNPGELPPTVQAFKSQQFRWCKGSIQTAIKLLPRIFQADIPVKIKAEAVVHLLSYTMHPLMILNMLFALPLLLIGDWTSYALTDVSITIVLGIAAVMSVGTLGPIVFYVVSQKDLYPDWKSRIRWLPFLIMIGTGIAVSNTRAWLEALLGVKSAFKRTPKLRIESRSDLVTQRNKYRQPLDPLVPLEFLMGAYCLTCVYFSLKLNFTMLAPLMVLYGAGFFYVAILSLREALGSGDSEVDSPETVASSGAAPVVPSRLASQNAA
jgi:cellulose synthase/poly-beta-1,6-N-acetylglucosamine synthase-like glycosyltransferase